MKEVGLMLADPCVEFALAVLNVGWEYLRECETGREREREGEQREVDEKFHQGWWNIKQARASFGVEAGRDDLPTPSLSITSPHLIIHRDHPRPLHHWIDP